MNIDNKNKKIPSPSSIIKKIYSYLDVERKNQLKALLVLTIFASLAESISIAILVPFISFFVNPEIYLFNGFFKTIFNFLNIKDKKDMLFVISFLFILIVLVSSYLKLKYTKLTNETVENITSDFRINIFDFLINQDFSYYFKHGTNEIMSNVSQKTGRFAVMIFAVINIFNSILITTGIILVLIFNEPFYTPILILIIGLFFFIIFKIKANSVFQKGQKVNQNLDFIINIFDNTVGYLPEIIIYNLKNFYLSIMTKASRSAATSSSGIRTISSIPRIFLETFVIILAIFFIFISSFSERSIEINISYLAILAFAAQKCLPLVNSVYMMSINFKGCTPTVLSFFDILEKGKKKIVESKYYEALSFNQSIKLQKISYKYNANLPKVLNNVILEIKKGEKVVVKGETGSGKSTLINIISGLLDPTEGRILIDDTEIKIENKKNWQKNISIVPQAIFLNNASILENIAIGINRNVIDIDRVKKSAKLAHINDFIENLPNKFNEEVGERGIRLSGGQKQRIGIARAFYRNSNLIIMDEPTNALDLVTENLVIESIKSLSKNITVIMISHSNNTLKYFDKIIDLDKLK